MNGKLIQHRKKTVAVFKQFSRCYHSGIVEIHIEELINTSTTKQNQEARTPATALQDSTTVSYYVFETKIYEDNIYYCYNSFACGREFSVFSWIHGFKFLFQMQNSNCKLFQFTLTVAHIDRK